jgi:hypothetical protein
MDVTQLRIDAYLHKSIAKPTFYYGPSYQNAAAVRLDGRICVTKKKFLLCRRSPEALALMRALKQLLDPAMFSTVVVLSTDGARLS